MQAKNVLYAAVGAPIVAARKVGDQVGTWRATVDKETTGYTEAAEKMLNNWASEGEKIVSRISHGAVVEEISSKVDLDQAKEQVSKLRDQLEEMLDTWRTSFKPEEKAETPKPATKTTTPAKKPAAKKTTTTKKSSAANKPATKSTAKKPAAKKTTTTKSSSTAKAS